MVCRRMSAFADGLGTTIHEFACHTTRSLPAKLVDGRTKSDHDDKGENGASSFDSGTGQLRRILVEWPAWARREIERALLAEAKALQPGPGDHRGVVGAQTQWWGDEGEARVARACFQLCP